MDKIKDKKHIISIIVIIILLIIIFFLINKNSNSNIKENFFTSPVYSSTDNISNLPAGTQLANIPNSNRSYSSVWNNLDADVRSTLGMDGWFARDNIIGDWIQFNLSTDNQQYNVKGVVIRGRSGTYSNQYVATFKVKYSNNDNYDFSNSIFVDNGTTYNGISSSNQYYYYILFINPIAAKSIRIYPQTWTGGQISMKADLLLDVNTRKALLPISDQISEQQTAQTASGVRAPIYAVTNSMSSMPVGTQYIGIAETDRSYFRSHNVYLPKSRLDSDFAWYANNIESNQWMQINIPQNFQKFNVKGVIIRGRANDGFPNQYVTRFKVEYYSTNYNNWSFIIIHPLYITEY